MAGFGHGRHPVERTATDAGQKNPAPARQSRAPSVVALHSNPGPRDVVRTANQASLIRQGLAPPSDLVAAEPAFAADGRTDLDRREGSMAVVTMGETAAGQLSNGQCLPTTAASVSRLRRRNWGRVYWDL